MSPQTIRNAKLLQIRTDALSAEYIYSVHLRHLGKISTALLLLSLLTPLVILVALYPSKGTQYETLIQWTSYISSGILLVLAVTSLALQVESKKENFASARSSNTFIAAESLELIANESQDATWFFRHASNQDSVDQKNIAKIANGLKQEAYRDSLKRLVPGDSSTTCSVCNASPYKFKAGDCQLCGNSTQQVGADHV